MRELCSATDDLFSADCFFKLGELQFALADYQQAHELSRLSDMHSSYRLAVVHHSIGTRCFSMADYTAAEDHFSSAIKCSPLSAHFYLCRARAKLELKVTIFLLNGSRVYLLSPQEEHRAREDTLRALLLDPNSEDNLPLTARLFPGNKVSDLVNSEMANELRPSLLPSQQLEGREKSPHLHHQRDPYLSSLLEGLTLQVEDTMEKEEEKEEEDGEGKEEEESPCADDGHHSTTSCSNFIQRPRSWPVLHQSPPPLLTPSTVPSLQACLKENEFHRLIYYSKKMVSCPLMIRLMVSIYIHLYHHLSQCTENVARLLNNK